MREEIREFKKQRILDVAERLFYECGYDATTVDLIAGELGVTKPFIYSYYNNKAAILEALYAHVAERMLGYLDDDDPQWPPAMRLQGFVRKFVLENIKNQVASGVYLQEEKHLSTETRERVRAAERKFNHQLAGLIDDGVARGAFHVENTHLASLSISGMVRWVHRWYHAEGPATPDEIAAQISDYALRLVGHR